MIRIAVVTQSEDLHAYAVRHELLSRGIDCRVIETDRLSGVTEGMSWGTSETPTAVCNATGPALDPSQLDLVWWRRVRMYKGETLTEPAQIDLVANDCQATLMGIFLTSFRGAWIDHPSAIREAENKLLQLSVAQDLGFRIPRTLVSQDPARVRAFLAGLGGRAIVKSVRGTPKAPLITAEVTADALADADIALCPAIYQELIPGSRHIRANVFGDRAAAALIRSAELDWRPRSDNETTATSLDAETRIRLTRVLSRLRLRMGVFDLKVTDTGDVYWLEVNPQGQFLFVQALSGLDLVGMFCDFLQDEIASRLPTTDGTHGSWWPTPSPAQA